ncbi:MAG TPA: CHAT domain-containing protein, partial [Bacteroidales bacterium]|nr:CHAT domain-containing protein [Bacteroidales bacterium]
AIQNVKAKYLGNIPKSIEIYENNLKNEIALYNKLIYDEEISNHPSLQKISLWRSKLISLNEEKTALENFLNKNYPSYYSLKYNYNVIKINEIQNKLNKDQIIIEYTYTDSTIFIFLVSKNNFIIKEVNIDSTFNTQVMNLLKSISCNNFSKINKNEFYKYIYSAFTLYKALIYPIEKNITTENIIIIPDGILNYIPFEILISSLPYDDRLEYRTLSYLIKKYTISYSYSATLLYNNIYKKEKAPQNLIAFAPEYNNKNFTYDSISFLLKPLPGAINEINDISKIIKTNMFLKDKATETQFKQNVVNYDIIHLAMHTIINNENPLYSKLVFYSPDDNKEDGFLNTYEIFNLKLNARLAVLSACNTGYGKLSNGEGVMSLARSFMYAGCPNIVMTLWQIEDKSSSEIMANFYKNL